MSWNVLENITSTGNGQTDLVSTLVAPATSYPIFWAMIVLIPLFIIISSRTFFKQKEKEGRANIWSSLGVSSFVTSLVAVVMNVIGLIDQPTLSWTIGVCGFFIVLFILLKE